MCSTTGPNATPPQLLAEYSDPFDLKKHHQDDAQFLGIMAVPPVNENDDYSVPYEVKKLLRGDLHLSDVAFRNEVMQRYSELGSAANASQNGDGKHPFNNESQDNRPKEDYDEPWEWSAKQSMLLQSHFERMGPQNFPFMPPPQLKRTNAPEENDSSKEAEASETKQSPKITSKPVAGTTSGATGGTAGGDDSDGEHYELTSRGNHEDSEDEGYTHLREELKTAAKKKQQSTSAPNYEKPWDLSTKIHEIDEKLKAAAAAENVTDKPSKNHAQESDTRSQEGYEKPWDWKPHQKDDRPQEGYEKPWDWKPHQKDDRPPQEYEEPWHQKQEQLIAKAGIKSVSAKSQETPPAKPPSDSTPSSACKEVKSKDVPPEDYNEPWDSRGGARPKLSHNQEVVLQKSAVSPVARVSPQHKKHSPPPASHIKPSPPPANTAPPVVIQSPIKRAPPRDVRRQSPIKAERVDPTVSLDKQGWYHGAISRVDAETLLRVHKEGSYLVRVSESNRDDYSLSLKSATGFMHMKIVKKAASNGHCYILGQFSQLFEGIPQMIHHYSQHKLPIRGADHMLLLHPIIHETL